MGRRKLQGEQKAFGILEAAPEDRRRAPARPTYATGYSGGGERRRAPRMPRFSHRTRTILRAAGATAAVGLVGYGLTHKQELAEDHMTCPAGIEWAGPMGVKPECKPGRPRPLGSAAVWAVAGHPGETVTGVAQYKIDAIANMEDPAGIGVMVSATAVTERFNQAVEVDPATGQPTLKAEDLNTKSYVAMMASADAEACVADLNRILNWAQEGAPGLVPEDGAVTTEQLRSAESLYTLKDHGGERTDDPDIPNMFVVFDANADGQPDEALGCVANPTS